MRRMFECSGRRIDANISSTCLLYKITIIKKLCQLFIFFFFFLLHLQFSVLLVNTVSLSLVCKLQITLLCVVRSGAGAKWCRILIITFCLHCVCSSYSPSQTLVSLAERTSKCLSLFLIHCLLFYSVPAALFKERFCSAFFVLFSLCVFATLMSNYPLQYTAKKRDAEPDSHLGRYNSQKASY